MAREVIVRPRFRWLVFPVLFGLALAPIAHAAGKNLLANPGMEQSLPDHPWMPAGWDTTRSGLETAFFGRDTLAPHSGSYSISVASASMLYPIPHNWSQTLVVGRELWGKDLVFSVWTRTLGLEGRAYIKLDVYRDTLTKMAKTWEVDRAVAGKRLTITPIDDPILDLGWKRVYFSEPETDWVQRQVRVFVPPSVNVVVIRAGIIGTGQLMVDDASLTAEPALPAPAPPLHTNLLDDPGFESNVSAWEYSLPPYPEMRAELDTTVVRSGRSSLVLRSPPGGIVAGKAGTCQPLSNRGLAGKRVRFTGFIKCDSLKSSAFLKLYCHTIHGIEQNASVASFEGTTDWSQASLEMDIPGDTYEVWAWFMYTAPAVGLVYFDDASLEVIGNAAQSGP